jgi:NitT/TauT family transport system substrate-binding protein
MMRFTRAGRVILAAAGGLAVALLAAACSGSSSATEEAKIGALEKTHLVVGSLPVVDTAGLYLAIRNGYFKQAGLSVTASTLAKSTDAIPEMEAGKVDVVAGANYVSFFQAQQANPKLRFKLLVDGNACDTDTFDVLTLPSSGIRSPAQLAGKTIAVNIKNNIQTLLTNTELQAANVSPASVRYVLVPFPKMVAALKSHQVDAISAVEPFITAAELGAGAENILSDCSGPTADFPISGYFATQSWAQKYPNTARAFQEAMSKGQAMADSSRAAVEQVLPTYIKGLSAEEAAIVNLGQYPTSIDITHLQRVASLMFTGRLVGRQFSVQPLVFR